MKENEFRAWLAPQIHPKTVNDYVSDIKRIERYYGDLDRLYETDRLAALIDELRCTPTEQPLHWIPINGDVRNGDLNARERGQTLSGISQGGRGGAAMTLRERVLAAIREQPGITINELVRRLDGPGAPRRLSPDLGSVSQGRDRASSG